MQLSGVFSSFTLENELLAEGEQGLLDLVSLGVTGKSIIASHRRRARLEPSEVESVKGILAHDRRHPMTTSQKVSNGSPRGARAVTLGATQESYLIVI